MCDFFFFFISIKRNLFDFFELIDRIFLKKNEDRKRVISARYFVINLIYVDFDCSIYMIINIFFSIKRNFFLHDISY